MKRMAVMLVIFVLLGGIGSYAYATEIKFEPYQALFGRKNGLERAANPLNHF